MIAELSAHGLEHVDVEVAAHVLHAREHGHERQLDLAQQRKGVVLLKRLGERLDEGTGSGGGEHAGTGGIVTLRSRDAQTLGGEVLHQILGA